MSSVRINDPDYRALREGVLNRDFRECIDCSWSLDDGGGKQLHVHHVVPERLFDDSESAHKEENLVTLCSMCHGAWEKEIRAILDGRPAWDSEIRNRIRKHLGDDLDVLVEYFSEAYELIEKGIDDE